MREKTTPREGKRRSVFLPWAEGKEKICWHASIPYYTNRVGRKTWILLISVEKKQSYKMPIVKLHYVAY